MQMVEKPIYVVAVVFSGVLDSVEAFHGKDEAKGRYLHLRIKHENDDKVDVSFWQPVENSNKMREVKL